MCFCWFTSIQISFFLFLNPILKSDDAGPKACLKRVEVELYGD